MHRQPQRAGALTGFTQALCRKRTDDAIREHLDPGVMGIERRFTNSDQITGQKYLKNLATTALAAMKRVGPASFQGIQHLGNISGLPQLAAPSDLPGLLLKLFQQS